MGKVNYIASISGGKDSAAMGLYLKEQEIAYKAVFFDTGWEHPLVYEYLRGELTDKIGPIEELQPPLPNLTPDLEELAVKYETRLGHPSAMVRWCIHKRVFPSRMRRWCTDLLKIKALRAYFSNHDYPVNCVGVRAAESIARSKLPERELSTSLDCMIWRPLLNWTTEDVIDIHHRHNLSPNPLYLQGAKRVGCWPCIYSRKSEIRYLSEKDPERVKLITDLERDLTEIATKHLPPGEQLKHIRTFFMQKGSMGYPPTIEEAIKWSKTSHGGEQVTLFSEEELEPSCMSWGLCDTGTDNG